MKHRKFMKVVSVILLVAFITGIVNTGAMPVKVSAAETGTNTINWSGTVTPDKVWIITYNSAVNVSTVNSNTIKVLDISGKEIPLSITVGIDGVSVSVAPVTLYAAGSYSLRVLSGINSISGVNLSNGLTINFTVAGKVTPDGIAITPQGLTLSPGGTARFTAALIGAPITGTFMWSVLGEGTAGSNGTGTSNTGSGSGTGANTGTSAADVNNGSISPQGDYLAPMDPGTYYIIAESIEYPGLKEIAGITVQTPPASPVDFMISDADLDLPIVVTPGNYVSLKVRVHNLTPSTGKAGGSVARFCVNGRIIDEVPFYLGINESYEDVTAHYYLPEGDYAGLPQNQQLPAKVKVYIDPYSKTRETNENNNTATSQFSVKGAYDISLDDTQPGLSIDPSGLSAWSMKYN